MNDQNLLEDQPIAWTPTPEVIERAQLTKFMRQVGVSTWDELYAYSINDVEKFTEEVIKFLDIKFDPPYEKLLDTSNGVEFPTWFRRRADTPVRMDAASAFKKKVTSKFLNTDEDVTPSLGGGTADADKSVRAPTAGLNITEMCLDRWQTEEMKDRPAVIFEDEYGNGSSVPYAGLLREVGICAGVFRHQGLKKGDAVGIHLPMTLLTVTVLLAINKIGAIAVPVFSGYGIDAIASRLNAVGAKALVTTKGFSRRGKDVEAQKIAIEAVTLSPTVEKVFVVNSLHGENFDEDALSSETVKYIDLIDLLYDFGFYIDDHGDPKEYCRTEPTSAEDPLIILYTSGTTGKPKGIAHTHASFPIKAAQDMAFGTDVGKGTRISWYTDIGWMMGPWLIYGALINGATICIYDGAPDYPTPDRMWEFCAKHKVEVLGISPTLVRSLAAKEGSADTPVRIAGSSGENSSRHRSDSDAGKSLHSPAETIVRRGWYRHKLPHYDGNVTQFITFRLADSLPQNVLEKIELRLEQDKITEFSEEFRARVEEYLDSGAGECILRIPEIAQLVEQTILNEHGKSCDVKAWVVMPNHAHVMLRPYEGHSLAGIMKRIKGVSARKINHLYEREGSVWQADYFDRYIRDEDDFLRKLDYIENNPVAAGLVKNAESWKFSSAWTADTPVSIDITSASSDLFAGGTGDADKSVRAPFERHDLSSLRIFASTGEPWNPAPWWWLFEKVGDSKLPIINYSGGTEISGGILMGNPLLPIKPCSFPAPCPGMDVDILDEEGNSVEPGKVGELVIKQPWIGMARGFWQEKERYLDTYWRRFKDIWVHGDFAMRDKDGHWFILGRSDDTLKVAGKRVGPAEVESLLVAHPLVTEAAVIGVPDERKGTAMVAFVVLSGTSDEGRVTSEDGSSGSSLVTHHSSLQQELKTLVAKDMGKPLAPSRIHFVSALPKTRNAKVMRRVIRSAYLGEDPGDLSALENPKTVDEIAKSKK
ncbi:MAG: REP-associated tyrosine transposase [Pyrinomonadaceae bacterium]